MTAARPARRTRPALGFAVCLTVGFALGFLGTAAPARAQISPGPLSQAHVTLEGGSNCLRCHQRSEGVAAKSCLSCHTLLAQRIAIGAGLHARADHRKCETCHIEHQGREFALVDWGPRGEAGFDHTTTGYALDGAHARLTCRECHRPEALQARAAELAGQASARRSYLGLERDCLSCHRDEHRGQFKPDACLSCHSMSTWKAPLRFDHAATAYPLTGRHAQVPCADCHPKRPDPLAPAAAPATQFRGIAHGRCMDCHKDPHLGRLGASCDSCHTTAGWRAVATAAFDHAKTRFPLLGKHRGVSCAGCHGAENQKARPPFARCLDCHRDDHLGQFARLPDGGACEACHTVAGFSPSNVTVERHRAAFALEGGHLAVPCIACHPRVPPRQLVGADPRLVAGARAAAVMRFHISGQGCIRCHVDPHRGELPGALAAGGCESCHRVETWSVDSFDHAKTSLPLRGRHATLSCAACHRRPEITGLPPAAQGPAALRLVGLPLQCGQCHADPHGGQFEIAAVAPGKRGPQAVAAGCARCHREDSWHALLFVHNRDSRYALDGQHEHVPCASCHPAEEQSGRSVRRYRPLPTACAGCHAP